MSPAQTKAPRPRSVPAQRSSGPETMRGARPGSTATQPLHSAGHGHPAMGPRPYRGEKSHGTRQDFAWVVVVAPGCQGTGCPRRGHGSPPAPPDLTRPPHSGHKPQQDPTSPWGNSSQAGRHLGCAARVPLLPIPVRRCPQALPAPPGHRAWGGEHRAVTPQGHRAGSCQQEQGWPGPTSTPRIPRPRGTPRSAAGWGPRLGLPCAWAAAAAPSVVNWIFPEPLSGESEIPGGAGAARTPLREEGGERRPPCPPSPSSAPRS